MQLIEVVQCNILISAETIRSLIKCVVLYIYDIS